MQNKKAVKIPLADLIKLLKFTGSKESDILIYIIEKTYLNIIPMDTFLGSSKSIAINLNISLVTVTKIMKRLQENNLITKVQNGVYTVNMF